MKDRITAVLPQCRYKQQQTLTVCFNYNIAENKINLCYKMLNAENAFCCSLTEDAFITKPTGGFLNFELGLISVYRLLILSLVL